MKTQPPKKVALAYSGGLDTAAMAAWLIQRYNCEIVTFTADIGQGEEVEKARRVATAAGITEIFVEDMREEFARDYIFPMFRANAVYEGEYLLGTSIARPLIARRLVEIARETGADAVAHGATGKGNDQVRFELAFLALAPELQIIAPWREWEFKGRVDLVNYCKENKIPVEMRRGGDPPCSMDANLLHVSYEGGHLEDPACTPNPDIWLRTQSLEDAPDTGQEVCIGFKQGDPISIDGRVLSPAGIMEKLNQLAGMHGIGRIDIVENRYVGMKSRGCYETPGGSLLFKARRALESIILDGGLAHLKDSLAPRYAELVYNGYWFSPEREALQLLMDHSRHWLEGEVRLYLYKGSMQVLGRSSPYSLYDDHAASFEQAGDDEKGDATGFIRLNARQMKAAAERVRRFPDHSKGS
ncbi:MAG: argininosuccinate synthase [Gammaproteobacteria bacterium]